MNDWEKFGKTHCCTDCLVYFNADFILLRRPREWDTKQREARQAKQE